MQGLQVDGNFPRMSAVEKDAYFGGWKGISRLDVAGEW